MGHLAKQKNAERRFKKAESLPPPSNKPIIIYGRSPVKASRKLKLQTPDASANAKPKGPTWDGWTVETIYETIISSYLPMLRTRLLHDYHTFLSPTSTLHPPSDLDAGISKKIDWKKLIQGIHLETNGQMTVWALPSITKPNRALHLWARLPLRQACYTASHRLPCGILEVPLLVTELEKYVLRRIDGERRWSKQWLVEQGYWGTLAKQVWWDRGLIPLAFEDLEERGEMLAALSKFEGRYYHGGVENLNGSNVRPRLRYVLTSRAREMWDSENGNT